MSARPRYLDAVLRIVAEPSVSAHFGCLLCPFTKSVKGRQKVQLFVPTIRATHRATCPGLQTSPHASTHQKRSTRQ